MPKLFYGLLILFLVLTPKITIAEPQLSLKEAINLTLKNNLSLASEKELLQKAEFEKQAQEQAWLPNLTLNSSYYYINKKASIVLPPPATQSFSLGDNNNFSNSLNLNYVLYNFGKDASIAVKTLESTKQASNLNQKAKSLALETARVYKSLESLYLQKQILLFGKEKLANELAKVESLIRNGAALPIQALTLKIAMANYDQLLLDVENRTKFTKDQMTLLTNESFEIKINPLILKLDVTDKNLITKEELSKLDLANNENIKILRLQKEIIENQKKQVLAENLPSFLFNASYNYSKPGIDPITNQWIDYFTVGAGLKWQLYDFGSVQSQATAVEKARDSLDKDLEFLERNLKNDYQNKVRDYALLQNQLDVAKKLVILNEEKLKLFDSQLQNGALSMTDFRDTVFELTQNKLNYFQNYLNLTLKSIEIDYLSGLPIEKWRLEE